MAITFSSEVLQKEGRLQDGKVTYNINVTLVNNELTRLYCGITKNTDTDADDNITESQQIGHIILEYGRQVCEIAQGENLIPHLSKFQQILGEVITKEPEPEIIDK